MASRCADCHFATFAWQPKTAQLLSRQTAEARHDLIEKNRIDPSVSTVSVVGIILRVRSIRPLRCWTFGIGVHKNTIHKDAIW